MPRSISGEIGLFSSVLVHRSLIARAPLLSRDNTDFVIVAIVRVCGASLSRPLAFDTVFLLDTLGCCIAFLCVVSSRILLTNALTPTRSRFRSSRISSGLSVLTSRSSSGIGLGLRGMMRRDLSASDPCQHVQEPQRAISSPLDLYLNV
jgi:hypothetical protein